LRLIFIGCLSLRPLNRSGGNVEEAGGHAFLVGVVEGNSKVEISRKGHLAADCKLYIRATHDEKLCDDALRQRRMQ